MERKRERKKRRTEKAEKAHAYKWYANKIHLSTMVVCILSLVSECVVIRARARTSVLSVKAASPRAACGSSPPDLFLSRGKQICRSIIDSVYDWNHLHDVCRIRTREKKSARILILSQSSSLLLPPFCVRACISRGLSSLLFSLSLTSSSPPPPPPLQPS